MKKIKIKKRESKVLPKVLRIKENKTSTNPTEDIKVPKKALQKAVLEVKPKKKKKKYLNVEPTEKQKKAFNALVENGCTKKEAMRIAGYSEAIQTVPKKVTESEGWKMLLDQYLPDAKLAKAHKEGLEAYSKDKEPDFTVRHKYLDTAYKLKGSYAPAKKEVKIEDALSIFDDDDDE